jgi:hypothetical protein
MGSLPQGKHCPDVSPIIPACVSFRGDLKKERSGITAGSLQPTQRTERHLTRVPSLSQHSRHRAYGFPLSQPLCQAALTAPKRFIYPAGEAISRFSKNFSVRTAYSLAKKVRSLAILRHAMILPGDVAPGLRGRFGGSHKTALDKGRPFDQKKG